MTELSTDRRFHSLTQEQIKTLDQVLTEVIPIHGRGNFPTLEMKPKDIIHMVRDKLTEKEIKVRDVRLNGSTASHVLVKENGTSYKDLDIIFGVELPKQEDFQIIKEVVLSCLLDFLPRGVNKDKITAQTMKEAYVQKMVKVFTEHDRWSLISLSNNSGKNVELKFVNSLRRQFEFSVDSFQIILDRMLESYLEAERRQWPEDKKPEDRAFPAQKISQLSATPAELPSTSLGSEKPKSLDQDLPDRANDVSSSGDSPCCSEEVEMREEEPPHLAEEPVAEIVKIDEVTKIDRVTEMSAPDPAPEPVSQADVDLVVKNIEAEGKEESILDKPTENLVLESQAQSKTSLEAIISLNMVTQVQIENSTDIESTKVNADPMPPIEEITNEVTLKVLCVSPCQSCECLSQETQHTEYPLPPPAKKTYKNLQMVILKHSSPKPPRKMSKKVTSMMPSTGKTSFSCEPPVVSQLLDPANAASDEPVTMEVDITGSNTNHCKLPTGTPQHEDGQVKLFDMQATASIVEPRDTGTDSQAEVTCSQSLSCELSSPSLEVTVQSVETAVTHFNDKDIPILEVVPPSPQTLEPAVKIPESAEQVPELATLAPESDAQEPENVTELPESTAQVLETVAQVAGPIAQAAVASSQRPVLLAQESTAQTSNISNFDTQSLEPDVQVPELDIQVLESDIQRPESNVLVMECDVPVVEPDFQILKSDIQVAEPDIQILESNVRILEPVAQCEKLQMEATSHKQETEATAPTRDLPTITVVAESMYGDFEQAMDHLRYRLIATRNPEEIRGGGLLKYSNLLVREFKPASETEIKTLERYMCSRFFIDFPDVNEQQRKIESYLRNHFIGEEKSKYDYLMTLRRVVNESTVCLMGHERRQTLNMITVLALKVLGEQNIIPNTTNVTCYYQPAPYMTDHSFNNYYMAHGQPPLFYQPYPLHIHMQTGLV